MAVSVNSMQNRGNTRQAKLSLVINLIDFVVILLWAMFGYLGYRWGLYSGLLNLFGLFFSLAWSLILLPFFAKLFSYVLELPASMSVLLGFTVIFAVVMLLYLFFSQWIQTIIRMEVRDWFNRSSGTLLGLYRGVLLVSLLAIGFTLLPLPKLVDNVESRSPIFRFVKRVTPLNYNYIRMLIPGLISFNDSLAAARKSMGKSDVMLDQLLAEFPPKKPRPKRASAQK